MPIAILKKMTVRISVKSAIFTKCKLLYQWRIECELYVREQRPYCNIRLTDCCILNRQLYFKGTVCNSN